MTCSTRIAIYVGTYTGKIIGTGLVILGLAFAAEGFCMWLQARRDELR